MGAFSANRSRDRSDEGAALVEFVAVIPVVLLLIFAIIEISWGAFAFAETWSAAREGARQATTIDASGGPLDTVDTLADCASVQAAVNGRLTIQNFDPGASVGSPPEPQLEIVYYDITNPSNILADCQGGPDPTTALGCSINDSACDGLAGLTAEVTVRRVYDGLPVPLIGDIFDGLVLQSTQARTIQSGRVFDPGP